MTEYEAVMAAREQAAEMARDYLKERGWTEGANYAVGTWTKEHPAGSGRHLSAALWGAVQMQGNIEHTP